MILLLELIGAAKSGELGDPGNPPVSAPCKSICCRSLVPKEVLPAVAHKHNSGLRDHTEKCAHKNKSQKQPKSFLLVCDKDKPADLLASNGFYHLSSLFSHVQSILITLLPHSITTSRNSQNSLETSHNNIFAVYKFCFQLL